MHHHRFNLSKIPFSYDMLSNDAEFKKLLLLHSRDRRKKTLHNELTGLPGVLGKLDEKIYVEKESIAIASNELKT